jgi:hypothetical protein
MTSAADDLEAKIAEVRARRAALADASVARQTPTVEETLATEERALVEDEELDRAEEQYGARAVRMVRTEVGAVILRRPHIAAFRKFQDAGELTSDHAEELVRSCLLFPSKPELDKLLRQLPGILTQLASVCVELAGHRNVQLKAK